MKLGFVSDSLSGMGFEEMLDHAAGMGVDGVEVNTGGWSAAPHCDLKSMLVSADARNAFRRAFDERRLEIVALNANGNPLHPADFAQGECLKDTIRVAGEMGIGTVCAMSGLPAGSAGDGTPNWVTTSWPPETREMLRYQWEEVLLPFWAETASLAQTLGIRKIALELHGAQCVYNAPTLLRLRQAAGPVIGANLDPSHLFWMGADPLAAATALGEAVFHVHAKDTLLNAAVQAEAGLLESGELEDLAARSWNYVTIGVGHGEEWWRRFCRALRMIGYDGWLSVEQEDMLMDGLDGLEKSVALLRDVMPVAATGPRSGAD